MLNIIAEIAAETATETAEEVAATTGATIMGTIATGGLLGIGVGLVGLSAYVGFRAYKKAFGSADAEEPEEEKKDEAAS